MNDTAHSLHQTTADTLWDSLSMMIDSIQKQPSDWHNQVDLSSAYLYFGVPILLILSSFLLLRHVLSYDKRQSMSEDDLREASTFIIEKPDHPHIESKIESLINDIREETHGLWAALLTINGIIATVVSFAAISQSGLNKAIYFLSLSTILCAFNSSYLLIRNYIGYRSWLERVMETLNAYMRTNRLTTDNIRTLSSTIVSDQIDLSERVAIRFVYAEAILVTITYIISVYLQPGQNTPK